MSKGVSQEQIAKKLNKIRKKEKITFSAMTESLAKKGYKMSIPAIRNYFIGDRKITIEMLLIILEIINAPKPQGNYTLTDLGIKM